MRPFLSVLLTESFSINLALFFCSSDLEFAFHKISFVRHVRVKDLQHSISGSYIGSLSMFSRLILFAVGLIAQSISCDGNINCGLDVPVKEF